MAGCAHRRRPDADRCPAPPARRATRSTAARTAFGRAEYQRAIEILHPLLYPEVLLDSEGEVVQAHRMLGVAYLFENKPDDARREFRKLLRAAPRLPLRSAAGSRSASSTSSTACVKEEEATIAAMEKRRREREKRDRGRTPSARRRAARALPPTVVRYERHSFAVELHPLRRGPVPERPAAQGLARSSARRRCWARVSVGAFATNFALYGLAPHRKCTRCAADAAASAPRRIDRSLGRRTRRAPCSASRSVSGGLFFAVAIWGVIDAIRHHQPEVPLTGRRQGRAPGAAPGGPARLTFSPDGLGAAWAF